MWFCINTGSAVNQGRYLHCGVYVCLYVHTYVCVYVCLSGWGGVHVCILSALVRRFLQSARVLLSFTCIQTGLTVIEPWASCFTKGQRGSRCGEREWLLQPTLRQHSGGHRTGRW